MQHAAHNQPYQTSELIAVSCLSIGFILEFLWPTSLPEQLHSRILGILLSIISLSFLLWTKWYFRAFKQSTKPCKQITALIVSGPFQWSRNPLYLAVVLFVVALGFIVDSVWVTVSAFVSAVLMHHMLILPEESYLEEIFHEKYLQYKERVGRWL